MTASHFWRLEIQPLKSIDLATTFNVTHSQSILEAEHILFNLTRYLFKASKLLQGRRSVKQISFLVLKFPFFYS